MTTRKIILLLIALCGFIPVLKAVDGCNQHLSPEEFRAKQRAFITEKAELTPQEAEKFFPLYFELQDRKKQLNDEAGALLRKGRNAKITDAEYGEMLDGVYDLRISINRLEKHYLDKFRKILSNKKLFAIQRAEIHFNRELLKGIQRNRLGTLPQKPPGERFMENPR
ncbi:MAG: hypothetical protein LBM62_00800 [Mediterranea sp.]|jgi:hypothetical protein|nr:hypothetical protein [Mediterranea sp.]